MALFEYAIYGNQDGSHQLLETSLVGADFMLEDLRFLVDRPAGQIGSEVIWAPYWGCGPLHEWWVLWRGVEDASAARKDMVRSRVAMVRLSDIGSVENLQDLLNLVSPIPFRNDAPLVGAIVEALASGVRPVIIPDITAAPALLVALWPYLWPAIRRTFALRTLFGSESLEFGRTVKPHVVVVPAELRPRWRSYFSVNANRQEHDISTAGLFSDTGAPRLERLIRLNWNRLPADFSILPRLQRIANSFETLQASQGQVTEALLIARTAEAFEGGLGLPSPDLQLLASHLSDFKNASVDDIRTASLVEFGIIGEFLPKVVLGVSCWVRDQLPAQPDSDALWILEQQAGSDHVAWWLQAVRTGLAGSLADMSSDWVRAIWRWWALKPEAVLWIQDHLDSGAATETALLSGLPAEMSDHLQTRVRTLCVHHQWARLLSGSFMTKPLKEAVQALRSVISHPETGLDVLLIGRFASEIVSTAVEAEWEPLTERAAQLTVRNVSLLDGLNVSAPGLVPLLAAHLLGGGQPPSTLLRDDFVFRLYDGCIDGDGDCVAIVSRLGADQAKVALVYARQDLLWNALGPTFSGPILSVSSVAWLTAFADRKKQKPPGAVLAEEIRRRARLVLKGRSVGRVIDFLLMFPEVSETEVVNWMFSEQFLWRRRDAQKFAKILIDRNWSFAARSFASSPKGELRAIAQHAKRLLPSRDGRPTSPPTIEGASSRFNDCDKGGIRKVKILFLAANPARSDRLAIDEEAHSIQEKVTASKFRDEIDFRTRWAVRPDDLQQALLEEQPTVVHFSGHGAGPDGIVLHSNRDDRISLVSAEALADLFKVLKGNIRVVVLNACYSQDQAARIVEEIDFVVGMADSIGDEAARVFAAAFYRGLGFGRNVQTAFNLGVSALKLENLTGDSDIPVLLVRAGVDATSETLTGSTAV